MLKKFGARELQPRVYTSIAVAGVALALISTSCSTLSGSSSSQPEPAENGQPDSEVRQSPFPQFLEATVEWSPAPGANQEFTSNDVQPVLHFIPGAIFGTPSPDLVPLRIASMGATEIQFPLYLVSAGIDSLAQPLTPEARASGLTVDPEATRFVRMGTFFLPRTGSYLDGAGIHVVDSDDVLVLVYVDRPSVITGTVFSGEAGFVHKLAFEESGFHWIRMDPGGGDVTNAQSDVEAVFMSFHAPLDSDDE